MGNTPTIPTDISDLTDTGGTIPTDISDLTDTGGTIPTDISDLTDNNETIATAATNAGFITGITVKNQTGDVVGFAGSITELDFNGSSGVTIVEKTPNSGIASILISGGVGIVTDVKVSQTSYSGTNPITTSESVGIVTISIASTSNAYGTRFIETYTPTTEGNNGDVWYQVSS